MKRQEIYQFGQYRVDPLARSLSREDVPVVLNRRAFDVLLYLVQNPGRVVLKDELLKNIWPDSFVEENNLTQSISSLRKALDDRPNEPSYISTLPGRGYQFIAPVEMLNQALQKSADQEAVSLEAATPPQTIFLQQQTVTTSIVTMETHPASTPRSRLWVLSTLVVAIAIAVGSYVFWEHHRPHPTSAAVVVANFANNTGDVTFDRTLKRALEIDLAQSPYMDVLSERGSVTALQLMGRSSDTALTPEIAREICERTNRRVVLAGTISTIGRQYLVTLQGTDCRTGRSLASAKAKANSREEVLEALDSVADSVRRSLNESSQSMETYSVPLREATTPSLDALEAFSMGMYLQSQSKSRGEIMAAFSRALDLDPQFAMAHLQVGIQDAYLGQMQLASDNFKKAFDLSSKVSTREQLDIRATYYAYGQRNLIEGIKAYQILAATYPQSPVPLADEMDEYMRLGQYGPAIVIGERAIKLFPFQQLLYQNLAQSYREVNRFDDAKSAAWQSAKVSPGDIGATHLALFDIALAQHDQAAFERECHWFDQDDDGTTVRYYPSFRGGGAATNGKYRQAEEFYKQAYITAQRANLPEAADGILLDQATSEFDLGFPSAARATLARIIKPSDADPAFAILQAQLGNLTYAEQFLALHPNSSPDTLMTYVFLPEVRAVLDLHRRTPRDADAAITALDAAAPYQMRDYVVPLLKAEAYMQTQQLDQAIAEYKRVLANPGLEPHSVRYPLAHLWLARAYTAKGNSSAAKEQYTAFFDAFKEADNDLPILQTAHAEFSAFQKK